MKTIFKMNEYFSDFCSNGELAAKFLKEKIKPTIITNDILFDFENIRNMNSSFSNALFSNLIMQEGKVVLKKISFLNCNDTIKSLIRSSINIGLQELIKKQQH